MRKSKLSKNKNKVEQQHVILLCKTRFTMSECVRSIVVPN